MAKLHFFFFKQKIHKYICCIGFSIEKALKKQIHYLFGLGWWHLYRLLLVSLIVFVFYIAYGMQMHRFWLRFGVTLVTENLFPSFFFVFRCGDVENV